jgi:hypothetical protein
LINCLLFISKHLGPRARVHWAGRRHRPRRFERALFFLLLIGAMAILERDQYLLWCIMWGGWLSLFISAYSIYRLVPRKRYHWAGIKGRK